MAVFDIWICEGRMCTANGSDAVAERARGAVSDVKQCRVLRGGCYGLCEIGPNVVVRRFETRRETPDTEADRLTLTEELNETVYSRMHVDEIEEVVGSHLIGDAPVMRLTREAREADEPSSTDVGARIRALREKRREISNKNKPASG